MATKHPDSLPELIAYQLLIVQHGLKFYYPSWLHYDIDFRTWAARIGSRKWSDINPQCYALAFTGQGTSSQWCPICFLDGSTHTVDCPNYNLPLSTQLPALPSRQGSMRPPICRPLLSQPLSPPKRIKRPHLDHCIPYNKQDGNCPYGRDCKYIHSASPVANSLVTRYPDAHANLHLKPQLTCLSCLAS